jgi:cell division protein FtsZ
LAGSEGRPSLTVVDNKPVNATGSAASTGTNYDLPPSTRARVAASAGASQAALAVEKSGEEYFDIPAFLRRQAD